MTDGGRAPSVLWGSVSPSVHWDTVYGLLPGSYVMTNVTEVCRCGWKPCLLGLPRWGLCVSCSHPGLNAHCRALCLEGVLSVCMKRIGGKKQVQSRGLGWRNGASGGFSDLTTQYLWNGHQWGQGGALAIRSRAVT